MLQPDPYLKLRAPAATPVDELCHCPGRPPLKLMPALSANPVHCMNCNLEVVPETLALDVPLIERIAAWTSLYDAIYRLWLDSADLKRGPNGSCQGSRAR